jgi:hypothetical protein
MSLLGTGWSKVRCLFTSMCKVSTRPPRLQQSCWRVKCETLWQGWVGKVLVNPGKEERATTQPGGSRIQRQVLTSKVQKTARRWDIWRAQLQGSLTHWGARVLFSVFDECLFSIPTQCSAGQEVQAWEESLHQVERLWGYQEPSEMGEGEEGSFRHQ